MVGGNPPWAAPSSRLLTKGWPRTATPTKVSQLIYKLKVLVLVVSVVVNQGRPVLVCLQLFAGLEANGLA